MTTTLKIMAISTGPLNTLHIITRLSDTTSDVLASVGVLPRILSKIYSLAFHTVMTCEYLQILNHCGYITYDAIRQNV